MKNHNFKNIVRLKVIAKALTNLPNKLVFVGGAIVDLYADDPTRGEVRPTDDIDVVVEILSRNSYSEIEERLREIGFKNDIESKVICRYKYHDIIVDIIPDDASALGFTNQWYKGGVQHAISFQLDTDTAIPIFSLAYFIASKIEALKSERHGKDYRFNSDFEDIVYIFDNRTTVLEDLLHCENPMKHYLKLEIEALLKRRFIEEEIATNLETSNKAFRLQRILTVWKTLSK